MKTYVIALVVLVGVLGGFYGGYKVGQNNVSASASTAGARASNTSGSNPFTGGRALGAACPSPGATPAAGAQTVTITGTRQADGSILAQTIQIGPAGGGARPGAGGGTTGTNGGGGG